MWLRQMAQLSTTMSQAHSATAFHWEVLVKCPGAGWLSCVAYLLDLEALLVTLSTGTGLGRLRLGWRRVCHVNVGHDYMVVSEWWGRYVRGSSSAWELVEGQRADGGGVLDEGV